MNHAKVGSLIATLRKQHGLTQRQLADKLHLSDKTISKWERGMGCPDVSLLADLSQHLGISVEKLLAGELAQNPTDGGNMRRVRFFVCPHCGNVLSATGSGELSCCGRRLKALKPSPAQGEHVPTVEQVEQDDYITFSHPMTKGHYLMFAAYVLPDRLLLVRLYPEQNAAIRIPQMSSGDLYVYCTNHGLMQCK